ncbi:MAG TPA: hypothetical protein VGW78_01635 [Candidatus Babeliales bacterium]|jgi:glycogen synthase|nr:hypothetical protein [Candidatus Babeliales bacterium]
MIKNISIIMLYIWILLLVITMQAMHPEYIQIRHIYDSYQLPAHDLAFKYPLHTLKDMESYLQEIVLHKASYTTLSPTALQNETATRNALENVRLAIHWNTHD